MMVIKNQVRNINICDLTFDPENPRFSMVYNDTTQPVDEIIERMVRLENVQELMGSISEQGYFDGEPLLVCGSDAGKFIVVEGNRRLAALKLLNGELTPSTKLPSIKNIIDEAKHKPLFVPCIVFLNRKEILRYLGYRHITGPKKWDSLSKAIYIKQLRDIFFSNLDLDEQLRSLAKEIGSRKDYVAKMLTSLNVLNYVEEKDFFGIYNIKKENVDFSILTTALSYTNIANYIGLENASVVDFGKLDENKSKDIFAWLFSQNQNGETVLGESRQLSKLAAVVSNELAVERLKKEQNLSEAYIFTEGPENAFIKSLEISLKNLRNAYEMVPTLEKVNDGVIELLSKIDGLNYDLTNSVNRIIRNNKRDINE
ncbi:ParB N-terminal domain-containing protein [Sodalis sp. C49]|uniref:ParB N-terminal domain-containing protein n=1 Tax=Sodalis sp. C49 TaxID=3228929 RepID=UPI003965BF03